MTRCNHLLESMSTKSDSTSINMDREGCSIPEVMAELHSIPGVSIEDDFHDFVTEFLISRRKREMQASMGDKQQKLRWLQRMYARTKRAQLTWYDLSILTINQLSMFKCLRYLYMFIFLLQSNGMPVFKRVVSNCRSLFEALYSSTFDFKAYEHMRLR